MNEIQSYSNHTRRVIPFMITLLALLAVIIGACVNLYMSWGDHERIYSASLILLLSICTASCGSFGRIFALKAQDRAIRAEENLRHFVLTGKLLDPRLETLQVVALRFASDPEFPDLAKQAADSSMKPDDIKKTVKSWRPDWDRV